MHFSNLYHYYRPLYECVLEKLYKRLNYAFSPFEPRLKVKQRHWPADRALVPYELSTRINERVRAHARDKYTRNQKDFETDDGSRSPSQSHSNHQLDYTSGLIHAHDFHTRIGPHFHRQVSLRVLSHGKIPCLSTDIVSKEIPDILRLILSITTFDLDWHLIVTNVACGSHPLVRLLIDDVYHIWFYISPRNLIVSTLLLSFRLQNFCTSTHIARVIHHVRACRRDIFAIHESLVIIVESSCKILFINSNILL